MSRKRKKNRCQAPSTGRVTSARQAAAHRVPRLPNQRAYYRMNLCPAGPPDTIRNLVPEGWRAQVPQADCPTRNHEFRNSCQSIQARLLEWLIEALLVADNGDKRDHTEATRPAVWEEGIVWSHKLAIEQARAIVVAFIMEAKLLGIDVRFVRPEAMDPTRDKRVSEHKLDITKNRILGVECAHGTSCPEHGFNAISLLAFSTPSLNAAIEGFCPDEGWITPALAYGAVIKRRGIHPEADVPWATHCEIASELGVDPDDGFSLETPINTATLSDDLREFLREYATVGLGPV